MCGTGGRALGTVTPRGLLDNLTSFSLYVSATVTLRGGRLPSHQQVCATKLKGKYMWGYAKERGWISLLPRVSATHAVLHRSWDGRCRAHG